MSSTKRRVARLLLVLVFVYVGFNCLVFPQPYVTKLNKVVVALDPLLKDSFYIELPLETIKTYSKVLLQALGGLALVGALGTLRLSKLGILLLVSLSVVAVLAELPVLYTEPAQRSAHLLSLLKSLGVLGGLGLLYTQHYAMPEDVKPKEKQP